MGTTPYIGTAISQTTRPQAIQSCDRQTPTQCPATAPATVKSLRRFITSLASRSILDHPEQPFPGEWDHLRRERARIEQVLHFGFTEPIQLSEELRRCIRRRFRGRFAIHTYDYGYRVVGVGHDMIVRYSCVFTPLFVTPACAS